MKLEESPHGARQQAWTEDASLSSVISTQSLVLTSAWVSVLLPCTMISEKTGLNGRRAAIHLGLRLINSVPYLEKNNTYYGPSESFEQLGHRSNSRFHY